MRDELHDAIDEQEDLADRAQAIVDALRPRLPELVRRLSDELASDEMDSRDGADIVKEALEITAAAAELKLRALTTEAVIAGMEHANRRAKGSQS